MKNVAQPMQTATASVLDDILREGARRLLRDAIEQESSAVLHSPRPGAGSANRSAAGGSQRPSSCPADSDADRGDRGASATTSDNISETSRAGYK